MENRKKWRYDFDKAVEEKHIFDRKHLDELHHHYEDWRQLEAILDLLQNPQGSGLLPGDIAGDSGNPTIGTTQFTKVWHRGGRSDRKELVGEIKVKGKTAFAFLGYCAHVGQGNDYYHVIERSPDHRIKMPKGRFSWAKS